MKQEIVSEAHVVNENKVTYAFRIYRLYFERLGKKLNMAPTAGALELFILVVLPKGLHAVQTKKMLAPVCSHWQRNCLQANRALLFGIDTNVGNYHS